MSTSTAPRIVVGVADTPESEIAVRWGARYAQTTGGTVHLVHAFVWPLMGVDVDPVPGITGSGLRTAAESLLASAVEIAQEAAPGVRVTTAIEEGRRVDVMLEASESADVIAVGSRGLGRLMSLVVGSTGLALASRSHCPVVVVRGDENTDGPIAVSYEPGEGGESAIRRGADLAATYGTGLHVVIGVETPSADEADILQRTAAIARKGHPDLEVVPAEIGRSVHSARELISASEGTRMIVIAARVAGESSRSAASQTGTVLQFANTPVWIERG